MWLFVNKRIGGLEIVDTVFFADLKSDPVSKQIGQPAS